MITQGRVCDATDFRVRSTVFYRTALSRGISDYQLWAASATFLPPVPLGGLTTSRSPGFHALLRHVHAVACGLLRFSNGLCNAGFYCGFYTLVLGSLVASPSCKANDNDSVRPNLSTGQASARRIYRTKPEYPGFS